MPNPNVNFNGVGLILPGAYTLIDASQLAPGSFGLANVIAILGDAQGGQPGTALYFRSAETAKRVLRGGDLLEGILMAYDANGLPDRPSADVVIAVRTDPATQSTLSLAGATGTPVVLTSRDWGAWTTGIQVKVEAGTSTGKKITISYTDPVIGQIVEVYDNLANSAAAIVAINNGIAGSQAASQFVTAASGSGTDPLTNIAFTPLAGGIDGTTTTTQWTAALNALANEDCDIVVPLSVDPTITALVQAHVDTLSGMKARKERVAIIGAALAGGFGTSALYAADCVSKAQAFADSRVELVAPGIKRPNAAGVLTSFGPQFTACLVAGITASLQIGESATHKYIKAVAVDTAFSQSDQENMLLGGAVPIEFVKGEGFRVVQAITTYQTDANPMFREMSVRRVGDFLMKNIRVRLNRDFVGSRGDATTAQAMLDTTVSILEAMKSDRVITAYQNVKVDIASGIARVTFEFSPSEPINYILITGFAKPGSLSVTFTGQASFSGAIPS